MILAHKVQSARKALKDMASKVKSVHRVQVLRVLLVRLAHRVHFPKVRRVLRARKVCPVVCRVIKATLAHKVMSVRKGILVTLVCRDSKGWKE